MGGAREDRTAGAESQGPPWILGQRGAALEAPENTLAALRRALELGADGVHYDVRPCAGGELVLLADESLERTTDARGLLADRTLPELFGVDAGGWFHRRYVGEPLPLFEEVLELEGEVGRGSPLHLVELRDPRSLAEVARVVRDLGRRLSLRVATPLRSAALELRDAGLIPMLVAEAADPELRRFVRDERIEALALPAGGWRAAGPEPWSCERWELGVDAPGDLHAACRTPLNGFTTHEPARALALRALTRLAPHDGGPYPLQVPDLPVSGVGEGGTGGQWSGRWALVARVRNPFPFDVRVACQLFVRRGAFEVGGLPARLGLAPLEEARIPFTLAGGSWSPGGDPLFAALFRWGRGPGRPAGKLLFDAPLVRRRAVVADVIPRRLPMLREGPAEPAASMTLRRAGLELLIAIENPGGLADARALCLLDGRRYVGGRGLRAPLPPDFDRRAGGVPFSCGMHGRSAGVGSAAPPGSGRTVRRWAGGLPEGPDSGDPGRLLPLASG